MLTEQDQKRAMELLADIGGRSNADETVVFEGKRLVIPERMSMRQAADFLEDRIEEEDRATRFTRTFPYRPWDGAWCAIQAWTEAFGVVGAKTIQTMFGPKPPQRITINVGPNETAEIPWGAFTLPGFDNTTIYFHDDQHAEYGLVFAITVEGPRKYRHQVEGLFRLVEKKCAEASIYRGKAFDGQQMPTFMDLKGVDPAKIVYSADVMAQLEANVWSVVRYPQGNADLNLPLKRAILLAGPYGTGKTCAANLTAQEAVAGGWTFIYAKPGRDDFASVMQTAKLYQPAVVMFEDAETIASPSAEEANTTRILDLFDGIQAKGTKLMVILTTNHPEKIHKGMRRPGRLDCEIHIGALDAAGMEKLIRVSVPADVLDPDTDFGVVTAAMTGYMPAFVKEAADRAIRYALVRTRGVAKNIIIGTADLVNAAHGLRPQFEAMLDAPEDAARDSIGAAISRTVKSSVVDLAAAEDSEYGINESVWNVENVLDIRGASK